MRENKSFSSSYLPIPFQHLLRTHSVGVLVFYCSSLTNYYKLGGLKQYKFILQFCRLEAWHGSHWANIKVCTGLHYFLESLKKNQTCFLAFFFFFFQFLEAVCNSLTRGSFPSSSKPATLHLSDLSSVDPSPSDRGWKGSQILRICVITLSLPR